jgi:hypothetical protein
MDVILNFTAAAGVPAFSISTLSPKPSSSCWANKSAT